MTEQKKYTLDAAIAQANKQEISARRNVAIRCIFLITCLCNTKQRANGGRLVVMGTFLVCLLGR
jgi:hypothetical protein